MIASAQRREYAAAALVFLTGAGAVAVSSTYGIGSLAHVGPGFFPLVLGCIMAFIGIVMGISAVFFSEAEITTASVKLDPRGAICILLGISAFLAVAPFFGMIPGSLLVIFICALGDRSATLKSSLLLAVGVTAVGSFLFSYLLRIQMPLLAW